jgi:hypothetical protein
MLRRKLLISLEVQIALPVTDLSMGLDKSTA